MPCGSLDVGKRSAICSTGFGCRERHVLLNHLPQKTTIMHKTPMEVPMIVTTDTRRKKSARCKISHLFSRSMMPVPSRVSNPKTFLSMTETLSMAMPVAEMKTFVGTCATLHRNTSLVFHTYQHMKELFSVIRWSCAT